MENLGKLFRRMALCAAVIFPMATSCADPYDDTEIRDKIDMIINKLYELEQRMNDEFGALNDLLEGQLFISSALRDTETGVTTITLSDGRTLELLPKTDLSSCVTYITSKDNAGKDILYWAYIDKEGKKQYFLDADGEAIPVFSETPEVITKDGETYLVIGGVEYPLSGNSVFSDYELITDELTNEVYAVTFTFGENMSFTVTVDGAAGLMFVKNEGWTQVAISEQYVPYGMTGRVQIQAYGVVDYVLQIPDGWRVKSYEDPFMGNGLEITAPSEEHVKSGIAMGEGELKAVAVLQGGKAMIAKLNLTTQAFKNVSFAFGKVNVAVNNGLYKFAYGACETSSFDEEAVFAQALENMDLYDYPAGYGMSFYDLVDEPLANILKSEPVPGNSYTVWVLPALYDEATSEYFLQKGTFATVDALYSTVKMEIVNQSSRDANINLEVIGAEGYYFGLSPKDWFNVEDVAYMLNIPDYMTPKTELIYNGSVFELAEMAAESSTEYVAWLVVAEEGKTYTAADVLTCEFATQDLQPGSSVKVAADVKASALDITANLKADGGEMIYYSFLSTKDAAKYTDDAARAAYLFENGWYASAAEGVDVNASDFISKMKPEMSVVLMALATDSEGKYSEILYQECKTTELQYNAMKVAVEVTLNSPEEVNLSVTTTGGTPVEYLYWIGQTTENTWNSANFLGASAEIAQEYMYLNSGKLSSIVSKYPVVDGVITITDHTPGLEYVIVIMAKDNEGLYSNATVLKFTPNSVNIGTIVLKNDPKYEAARPSVTWNEDEFIPGQGMMFGVYSYNVTVPKGFTAYILSGTDNYFLEINPATGEVIPRDVPADEKILKVINIVDKHIDSDYYDDDGKATYYSFQHGDPNKGNVVLWASKEFHDSRCDCGAPYDIEGSYMGNHGTIHHELHINDGKPFRVRMPSGFGDKTKVVDRVFIVCQDEDGNCYEAFEWDVPVEYFANSNNEW